jgi:hypothetical protein
MKTRTLLIVIGSLLGAFASAQGWSDAYENALSLAASGDWAGARNAFASAIALRPEDQSGPTSLPGPVTDPRKWRNGSPYSPNFGAAYSTYRQSFTLEGTERNATLSDSARQFEVLLAKGQGSAETFFFLNRIYSALNDIQKLDANKAMLDAQGGAFKWKVDTTIMTPEERGAVASLLPKAGGSSGNASGGPTTTVIKATDLNNSGTGTTAIGSPPTQGEMTAIAGRVPVVPTKYALIIGNSEGMMKDDQLGYASSDAVLVRDALVQHAGYAEANIDVVVNATAAQILASVKAIAERMPQDGTIFIYYTGLGFNIAGKDYYAGIDAETPQDSSHMVAVTDVYKEFIAKGASIFAFTQAPRSITSGLYFGKETPLFGRVAQAHATIPGQGVNALVIGGKTVGAYTQAVVDILTDFRSNQIPVTEFVWQVFYKMRRGGGPQTPTLPVLTVLSADSRF